MTKVYIAWKWLPFYAARSIGRTKSLAKIAELQVFGTPSRRGYKNLDEQAGQKITWLPEGEALTWAKLGVARPDIFITTGWEEKSFLALARDTKRLGGICVCMVDNRWRGDLRQLLGGLYYRLFYRRVFDGAFVPGASARKFVRYLGVPADRIWDGLYGADLDLFRSTSPVEFRPNRIVYIGALIARKGVDVLVAAWRQVVKKHPNWTLAIYGNGHLGDAIQGIQGIEVHSFVAPESLPDILNSARCLVLPSYDDNWGVVVHEAVSCNCAVITSNHVGASVDLVRHDNGRVFKSGDSTSLRVAMEEVIAFDSSALRRLTGVNAELRGRFGVSQWDRSLGQIVRTFSSQVFLQK